MSDDLREDKKKKRTATSRISSQVFSLPILDSGFWFCGMWEGREVFLCHTAKSPGRGIEERREREMCNFGYCSFTPSVLSWFFCPI